MKKIFVVALAAVLFSVVSHAKIIALHGDSTQYGYGMQFNPATMLQMQIDKSCGVGAHTVVNKAWGGTTAQQALSALPTSGMYDGKTFASYIASAPEDIIIANWGINDNFILGKGKWWYAYDHTQMARIAKSWSKIYIAETSNPLWYQVDRNASIAEWAATLVVVGAIEGYPVFDAHTAITTGFPFWNAHLPDGIHPNQSLHFFTSWRLFNFLKDRGYLC
jgi:GDSL-like Lipase/Acylhydrolase family